MSESINTPRRKLTPEEQRADDIAHDESMSIDERLDALAELPDDFGLSEPLLLVKWAREGEPDWWADSE